MLALARMQTIVQSQGTERAMTIERLLLCMAAIGATALRLVTARAENRPILLELNVESAILDEVALSEAIRRELDRPLVSSPEAEHAGEVSIRSLEGFRISVTYRRSREQPPLVRIVSLPRVEAQRTQWIAWLVGNLARDEAADWLEQHGAADPGESSGATSESAPDGDAVRPSEPTDADPKPPAPTPAPVPPVSPPAGRIRAPTDDPEPPGLEHKAFNLSLWYKWLQLHPDSASLRFAVHLGAGYGRVGSIRGLGFDVLHHRVDRDVRGAVGAFIWTRAPRTYGLAWSAGVITAEGRLRGTDFAWIFSYRDAVRGGPAPRDGASDVIGAQFGGIGAWNRGSFAGAQGAGVFTKQQGLLRGIQMSFAANVSEAVHGVQIAAVNVAGEVRGVQFGLVNYARRVNGIAIGLVNVSQDVRVQALAWAERDYSVNLGVRYVYRPLTFGYSLGNDPARHRNRIMFGIGARFERNRFAVTPSVNVGFFADNPEKNPTAEKGPENDARVSLEWEVVPRLLGFSAGPALAMQSDRDMRWKIVPRWFVGLNLF